MTATEHNFQIFQFWTLDFYSCYHGTQYPNRRDQCFKHADRHRSVHLVWVAAVPAYIIIEGSVQKPYILHIYERVAIGRKIEVRLSSNLLTLRACPELISHAIWLRFNYVGAITFGTQIALTIWQSVSLEWSNSSPKSDNNFVCK